MRPPRPVQRPQRELHLRSQWRSSHASPPPSTALRGPRGSEGPSGAVCMRLPSPVRRFVAIGSSTEDDIHNC
eukprot:8329918-Pyramimonas_sp.AAC.1